MQVIKKDGSVEVFDYNKIVKAVEKALHLVIKKCLSIYMI